MGAHGTATALESRTCRGLGVAALVLGWCNSSSFLGDVAAFLSLGGEWQQWLLASSVANAAHVPYRAGFWSLCQ